MAKEQQHVQAFWHAVLLLLFAAAYLFTVVQCSMVVRLRLLVACAAVLSVAVAAKMHCINALEGLSAVILHGCLARTSTAIWLAKALRFQAPFNARASSRGIWTDCGSSPQAVGMTADEVAFAEQVLCSQAHDRAEAVLHSDPESLDSGSHVVLSCLREGLGASDKPSQFADLHSQQASVAQQLRELHSAVEAGDARRMRTAIDNAKAACVGDEEITFAEAVLRIEEARIHRAALHSLRRSAAATATGGDLARLCATLRAALRQARVVGIGGEEVAAAEVVLQEAEARTPRAPPVLRLPHCLAGKTKRGGSPARKKKVTFADSDYQADEVPLSE